jgi:hypothetical protein
MLDQQVFSMESQLTIKTDASPPKDKSLEAYMTWIMDQRLSHNKMEMTFTKAEWAAAWKEFWKEGSNY